MEWIIGILVVSLIIFLWWRGKMKKAMVDVRRTQFNNLSKKAPINIDNELKEKVLVQKRQLGRNEVIIKNKYSQDIMVVTNSKWKEIQTHMDAPFWDRLDDKV